MHRGLACAALALCGCDFHFADFHAADATLAQDASTPAVEPGPTREQGAADPGAPEGSPFARDGGSVAGDASQRAPDDIGRAAAPAARDAGPAQEPCAGAASASCPCDPRACLASPDAGADVPPGTGMAPPPAPGSAPLGPQMPTAAGVMPVPGLLLRYDFAGEGVTAHDRVGAAHGALLGGARLDGAGALMLDGRDDYVDVPALALSNLDSVSVVSWVMSPSASCWQRVFDFGNTLGVPGELTSDALLVGELFLTPDQCPDQRVAAIARNPAFRQQAQSPRAFPRNRPVQLVVVYDNARQLLTLYIDGARANETGATMSVPALSGGVFWLGRSLWGQDPFARLRYDELRVYDRALSADQVAELARRGADQL